MFEILFLDLDLSRCFGSWVPKKKEPTSSGLAIREQSVACLCCLIFFSAVISEHHENVEWERVEIEKIGGLG